MGLNFGRRDLTPFRKLELELTVPVIGSKVWVDVTRNLGSSEVVFEEVDNGIDELRCTIRHGAIGFIERLRVGQRVRFSGGYAADREDGVPTRRTFFLGPIIQLVPQFPDTGIPELGLVCRNELYLLTRSKPGNITYPGIREDGVLFTRNFHFRAVSSDSSLAGISISEIVGGILAEYGLAVGQIKIAAEDDYRFTFADPVVQSEKETDFDFLRRLLTGEGKEAKGPDGAAPRDFIVCANARMFSEVDPETGESAIWVVPEADLVDAEGAETFVYQVPGLISAKMGEYDPTSPGAELVVRSVSVREELNEARGREKLHAKDLKLGAKAKKDKPGAPDADEEAQDGDYRSDENGETEEGVPEDLLTNYDVNYELIKADEEAGVLSTETAQYLLGIAPSGDDLNWAEVKKYFIPKEVQFNPEQRVVAGGGDLEANPVAGDEVGGSGGKGSKAGRGASKKLLSQKAKKYGMTLTLSTHGSVLVLCRQTYWVTLPSKRYGGAWYMTKLTHSFGDTYRINAEFGR